ncbi:uncharacterized protein LOC110026331 [Phalaenopsis equestris]|uniref:uncharacterized protein LOC110026331 n=1 Tax=Phalaenopsis equestris TaxID=78828 RepID=UPI0009E296B4|nr:uncharacterized protein LOC110026331 [Phalaenopsis equestris]
MCNVEIPRRTSAAGAFTECPECNFLHLERYGTFEEYTAANMMLRNVNHPEVEPYIPRFVETPQFWTGEQPRHVQRIPAIELERMSRVRKQEFEFYEEIRGKSVNILEGLELHTGVFSERDERRILDCVFDLRDRGRAGLLMEKTYSEPQKWMRGKGRITIQCGCCYNFTRDRLGNPQGILRYDELDPLPFEIKRMIKRMVRWSILPADCIPNSCIINIYEGDCIPPHIDHHDFVRPFCTVSFMSKSNILFGREIDVLGPGEFRGSVEIPLPVGSVLILKGNGADLAKHCIPGVPHRRISVTLRRMDDSKVPHGFRPDVELEELRPY